MLKLEIFLEEEQIKECFENAEIKFSKKKMKEILEQINDNDIDIKEILENALMEVVEEIISEEYEN